MKRFFFISILLVFIYSCKEFSNKPHNNDALQDSIQFYIGKANDFTKSDDEVIGYLDNVNSLIKLQERDSIYFINKFHIAFIYDNVGKRDQFKKIMLEVVEGATKENDSVNLARAYSYIGEYYAARMVMDSAVMNFQHAEKIFFKLRNNLGLGNTHVKMASAKYKVRDYLGSEKSAVTALTYIRLEKNKLLEYRANNILGLTCLQIKEFDKAKEYFEKSHKIAIDVELKTLGQYQTKAISLNNLGLVNLRINNFKEALYYFNQAQVEPDLFQEHPSLYALILDNKAKTEFKMEDYGNLPKAFHKALHINKGLQLTPEIVNSKINLSEYYKKIEQTDSAQYYAREAYKMAKSTNVLNLQLQAIVQLSNVEPDNENAHFKEYIQLSDSLLAIERKVSGKFARIEFETDEVISEKEKAEQEKRQMLLILVLVAFSGCMLLVIIWQRNRQKQLELINSQQKASEEIYQLILDQQIKFDKGREKEKKRIARELHDGILNNLAGIRYNLFKLEKKRDDETIENCLNHISELHNVEKEIRNIAHDLNLEVFSPKNDYVTLLNALVKENEYEGIYINLEIDFKINWESISSLIKMNSYRILQESFTNIKKHSKATEVTILFFMELGLLIIEISDNGIGFDLKTINTGLGLSNIKERAEILNGTLTITSEKQKFTKIKVNIPL